MTPAVEGGRVGGGSDDPVVTVDARGLRCPLPVLRLAQAITALAPPPRPTIVRLLADDPAAATDVAAFCRMRGLSLLATLPPPSPGEPAAYLVLVPAQRSPSVGPEGGGQAGPDNGNACASSCR